MATLKEQVFAICQEADLSSLTERKIRAQLAREIGQEAVERDAKAIKGFIEQYIEHEARRQSGADADYKPRDDEQEPEEEYEPEQPKAKKSKVAKQASSSKGDGGTAGHVIDLGAKKRITVSNFKGSTFVDMREWYDKDGELAPGKKGISLRLEEWRKLIGSKDDISAAVSARDVSYSLHLAPKRKVTLSFFKGALYVGVREFYEKDGKELPGAKGLSMNEAQWKALAAAADDFTASLS